MKYMSIKHNFLMNAVLSVSSILFPLISFPYVSRILQPEGIGKVAFATSIVSYFSLFSQLGIPTYGIRACAKVRDDKKKLSKTVQELLIINISTTFIVYIIFMVLLAFVPKLHDERNLYFVISFSLIFNALGMEWLYKGLEQYTYITVRSVTFKLIALIAMIVLIRRKSDYVIYGGLSVFASSASCILNFIHSHKYVSLYPVKDYHFKRHIKPTIVFFAMSCAVTIYTHIDSVMLGLMVDNSAVGYYDAAVKVKTALSGIVTSLGTVLLPRSSYYIEQGRREEFKTISTKAMNFVFLLSSPLMIFFIMFAKECIYLLSGSAYDSAVLPMQFIMPTILLIGITNITGIQILVPLGKEKVVLCSEICGALTDFIMNIILIPFLGVSGASLGTLAAEIVVLVVQFIGLKGMVTEIFRGVSYGKIFGGLLIAIIASCCLNILHLGNFLTLFFGACIFFGSYIIFLLLDKEPFVLELWNHFAIILNKLFTNH